MAFQTVPSQLPLTLMIMQFLEDNGLLRTLLVFREETAALWLPFTVSPGD